MPAAPEGLFSTLPAAVAAKLEAAKAALGLKRVTVGTMADGFRFPEVFVSFPEDDTLRAEADPATGRPGSRWLVPVSVVLLAHYPQPSLEAAILLAEKVAAHLLAQPGVGEARSVHLASMAIEEGVNETKQSTYGVDIRFVYSLVLART